MQARNGVKEMIIGTGVLTEVLGNMIRSSVELV
jgi:hypothetical protein